MHSSEAFKAGFLARCLSDGVSLDEIPERVKQACELLEKPAGAFGDVTGALGSAGNAAVSLGGKAIDSVLTTAKYGIPLALAAPPLAGLAAGYAGSKLTDTADTDVEELKKKEMLHELRHQTDVLNRLAISRR